MSDEEKKLADLFKEFREEIGMTQHKLATDIGCHPATVTRWERGASVPQAKYLKPLMALASTPKAADLVRAIAAKIGFGFDLTHLTPKDSE